MRFTLPFVALAFVAHAACGDDAPPRSHDPRLKIELFAEAPQIVTPTGMDVDHRGRVLAIESNTHFRPAGYQGHASDRVLVMSDTNGDGRADRIVTFTDGLTFTMSVAAPALFDAARRSSPPVYVATRQEILAMFDDNADDQADRKLRLIHLETTGNYPHNGLAGFAFDGLGWMYFGCGENLGADYKIVGADGASHSGGGEGGSIYRCRLDGTRLERWATGFWNPHASCVDAFGRLFTVDNDPDSRPPCRLLHVISGGDYGYRFRNGRKGLHPFTSWNGELPGTLPMVAGTGEAPSGVVACESAGLPDEYRGNLLATSWGDHRIDRFRLQPRGASFTALAEPLISGSENFRPVGLAFAPDGSLYCTDWVLRDYNLHGKGRVWRISQVAPPATPPQSLTDITPTTPTAELEADLIAPGIAVRRRAAQSLAATSAGRTALRRVLYDRTRSQRARVESLWALASAGPADDSKPLNAEELFAVFDSTAAAAGDLAGSERIPLSEARRRQLTLLLFKENLDPTTPRVIDGGCLISLLGRCRLTGGDDLIGVALAEGDPFVMSVVIRMLTRDLTSDEFARILTPGSMAAARVRITALLAARQHAPRDESVVELGLADHDPDVRRLAVQWVAEEQLTRLRPQVDAVLESGEMTAELFVATLAALKMLDGVPPADIDKTGGANYLLPLLQEGRQSLAVKIQALRLISPAAATLSPPLWDKLLSSGEPALIREAIRTLQFAPAEIAGPRLMAMAEDTHADLHARCDALVALTAAAKGEKPGGPLSATLVRLLAAPEVELQIECLRGMRGLTAHDAALKSAAAALAARVAVLPRPLPGPQQELADQAARALDDASAADQSPRPTNKAEWLAQLNRGRDADAAAGRRVFFHPQGPGCFKCHRVEGRGGLVGPDLSRAVSAMNRIQLIQSILEPGAEIAPQWVNWAFEMKNGQTHSGLIVKENEGQTVVGDAEGNTITLKTADIAERTPQKKSVMPENLGDRLTLQEFRDLLAFLESLR